MRVPLFNFEGGPRVLLLNFEEGPGVPLLNFQGGPGSLGPEVLGSGVLVTLLHHAIQQGSTAVSTIDSWRYLGPKEIQQNYQSLEI